MPGTLFQRLRRHRWGLWDLRSLLIDVRYRGLLGGRVESRFPGANAVQSLPYYVIKDATDAVGVDPDDVLVDIGSGPGRVLNWWLSQGFRNRMVGIELDPDVAARARSRLRHFHNVEIVTGDAVALTPPEATVCFLSNPFNRDVMQLWHDAVVARTTTPRLSMVYVNCHHLDVFLKSGRWSVESLPKDPADHCPIAVARLKR